MGCEVLRQSFSEVRGSSAVRRCRWKLVGVVLGAVPLSTKYRGDIFSGSSSICCRSFYFRGGSRKSSKTVDNALGVGQFCWYFYSTYSYSMYCSMYSAMHKKRYKFYIQDFYAENWIIKLSPSNILLHKVISHKPDFRFNLNFAGAI